MHTFAYVRPTLLAEAVALLEAHGPDARLLAGGTDLIIRLRDGTVRPGVVIDIKRIAEMRPSIREEAGCLVISAGTVMTDIAADERVRCWFPALAEGARIRAEGYDPARDLELLLSGGGRLLCPSDAEWPTDRLTWSGSPREAPPWVLFLRGPLRLDQLVERSVSLVGARAAGALWTDAGDEGRRGDRPALSR